MIDLKQIHQSGASDEQVPSVASGVWSAADKVASAYGTTDYGKVLHYAEDDTESTTTDATNFTDKLTIAETFEAGDYQISLAYTYRGSIQDIQGDGIIEIDGSTSWIITDFARSNLTDVDAAENGSVTIKVTLTAASHTIKFRFKSGSSGNTFAVKQARMMIFRVV